MGLGSLIGAEMGLRLRKSFKLAPGVRMTVSRSGVGYSVGGGGVRVTKRAGGGLSRTIGIPGSGITHTGKSLAAHVPSLGQRRGRRPRP